MLKININLYNAINTNIQLVESYNNLMKYFCLNSSKEKLKILIRNEVKYNDFISSYSNRIELNQIAIDKAIIKSYNIVKVEYTNEQNNLIDKITNNKKSKLKSSSFYGNLHMYSFYKLHKKHRKYFIEVYKGSYIINIDKINSKIELNK